MDPRILPLLREVCALLPAEHSNSSSSVAASSDAMNSISRQLFSPIPKSGEQPHGMEQYTSPPGSKAGNTNQTPAKGGARRNRKPSRTTRSKKTRKIRQTRNRNRRH
jgi:hypothetical protein